MNYYVDFNNQTSRTWTMAVYQSLPSSIGLDSVSWKQTTVAHGGLSGVQWDISYNVAIGNYVQRNGIGVYKASQILPADLGTAWDIVFEEGVQQLIPAGSAPLPDQIVINNESGFAANPGVGMSGQGSVFKQDVLSESSAQFTVTPTYWAGLFNDVVLGEVIKSNVIVGPLQLAFPSGRNLATLTATLDGEKIKLTLSYGSVSVVSLAKVEKHLKALEAARQKQAA
jgi:rhizosphere induced protein